MGRKLVILFVFVMGTVTVLNAQGLNVSITAPIDSAQVPERLTIEGTVSDQNSKVWVIVHPMEVSTYWVQPDINIKKNGNWKAVIYIGRPGAVDVGKHFEVMAVANPKVILKEGQKLEGWPDAQAKSEGIELIRR
ncbi:MAG: hypothetical protein ACLQBD_21600 [Syntrophobacteraceae bacterium]